MLFKFHLLILGLNEVCSLFVYYNHLMYDHLRVVFQQKLIVVGQVEFLPYLESIGLDVIDGVRALNLEGDSLTGQSLHEDLHGI